jgi:biofilm PGA synthesis N-glycosyltransferase PgaC
VKLEWLWTLALAAWTFMPIVIIFEWPLHALTIAGLSKRWLRLRERDRTVDASVHPLPRVSCIITCYSEGVDVIQTIRSLACQTYGGPIDIFAMVDGAVRNRETYRWASAMVPNVNAMANRELRVVPKWQRGGRVSSLNSGLALVTGEIVMVVDADTSFDDDMVANAVPHFADPNVVAVAGNLRVRNSPFNWLTRLQGLEYMITISLNKTAVSEFNVVNNISGAFGIFRRELLLRIGGWNSGTAEDLDLTLRIKQYFGRYPQMRIVFDPRVVGHTAGPDTVKSFLNQRLRWDGDLFYEYVVVHPYACDPRVVGVRTALHLLWSAIIAQLLLPPLIFAYFAYVVVFTPVSFLISAPLVYAYYVFCTLLSFVAYLAFISERKREDAFYLALIPIFPLYVLGGKLWTFLSLLGDAVCHFHLDSAMAPWWVLRKVRS